MDLSKRASDDALTKRTSAGSLFPALMTKISPGTICSASSVTARPSLIARQWSGSMVLMDAMTRDDDQSCHMLNAAWMKKTASRTMARARFAGAGGLPSGRHAMKTSIDATSRMGPKPLKKYPRIWRVRCVGGSVGAFLPYWPMRRWTCSVDRPCSAVVERRLRTSSTDSVCHSSSATSVPLRQPVATQHHDIIQAYQWPQRCFSS